MCKSVETSRWQNYTVIASTVHTFRLTCKYTWQVYLNVCGLRLSALATFKCALAIINAFQFWLTHFQIEYIASRNWLKNLELYCFILELYFYFIFYNFIYFLIVMLIQSCTYAIVTFNKIKYTAPIASASGLLIMDKSDNWIE